MDTVKKFSELGIKVKSDKLRGDKAKLHKFLDVPITVHDFRIMPSKYPEKSESCLWLQFSHEGKMHLAFSIAKHLIATLKDAPENATPFNAKITNKNDIYEFED